MRAKTLKSVFPSLFHPQSLKSVGIQWRERRNQIYKAVNRFDGSMR